MLPRKPKLLQVNHTNKLRHARSVQAQTKVTGNLDLGPAGVQMSNAISAESIKENDDLTRFYTGLPQWSLIVQIYFIPVYRSGHSLYRYILYRFTAVVTHCTDIFYTGLPQWSLIVQIYFIPVYRSGHSLYRYILYRFTAVVTHCTDIFYTGLPQWSLIVQIYFIPVYRSGHSLYRYILYRFTAVVAHCTDIFYTGLPQWSLIVQIYFIPVYRSGRSLYRYILYRFTAVVTHCTDIFYTGLPQWSLIVQIYFIPVYRSGRSLYRYILYRFTAVVAHCTDIFYTGLPQWSLIVQIYFIPVYRSGHSLYRYILYRFTAVVTHCTDIFYTGLPQWSLIVQIFLLLSPFITPSRTRLTLQDELILVLVKLRFNPPFQDLAYRWGVSISTVTRMFHKWIDVMNERMGFLIKWPNRDILRHNLPQVFKDTKPATICIIDCSEIFIERSTSFEVRAKTYSQYKKHNIAKFLIGITPCGTISYVSRCWGGRVSDRYLTQRCGFLELLQPGDLVLADRGFNIEEDLNFHGTKLAIPAYTRGKKQLSLEEVE